MKRTATLFSTLILAAGTIAATPAEAPVIWNVDASHTQIEFSVKHFFTPVRGQFTDFEADVNFDPTAPEEATVSIKIPVSSVDTRNERRDTHLQSADFFDAEAYPYITFTSTKVKQSGEGEYRILGDLTIRDVTREVVLPVTLLGVQELEGEMSEMFGGITQVASFTGNLKIDRNDFGVGTGSWAATAVVGGDVNITFNVETNR
jgi:polyisoprenoid-binding protein YceI